MTLTAHSKHVILAVIISIFLLLVSYKLVAHFDGIAHDQAVLAKSQVDADLQKAKIQAGQTAQANQALQVQLTALAASNANLASRVSSLQNQLVNQRKQDDTLNSNDLAIRWATLLGTSPSEIKPSANGIETTSSAAHSTVNALEEIPVIKQEEQALRDNSVEKDKTIQSQKNSLDSTTAELTTCKKTVVDQDTACKAEVKAVKAAARKHAVWSAIGGFIGGLIFDRFKK